MAVKLHTANLDCVLWWLLRHGVVLVGASCCEGVPFFLSCFTWLFLALDFHIAKFDNVLWSLPFSSSIFDWIAYGGETPHCQF